MRTRPCVVSWGGVLHKLTYPKRQGAGRALYGNYFFLGITGYVHPTPRDLLTSMQEIDMIIGAISSVPSFVSGGGSVLGVIRHRGYPVLRCRFHGRAEMSMSEEPFLVRMPMLELLLRPCVKLAADRSASRLLPLSSCGRRSAHREEGGGGNTASVSTST